MRDDQSLQAGAHRPAVSTLGRRIRDDLESLWDLPALSPVVVQLSATLGKDDVEVIEVEAIIGRDPVVAARVLSAANAAAYASLTPTTSIRGALMRLGLVRVRRLAMLMSVYNAMPVHPDLQATFWAHSLGVAHTAEAIARRLDERLGADSDSAFLAGLLHDIGLLVLASHYPKHYAAAKFLATTKEIPLWQAERALLDTDHAEISGYLAGYWSFPEEITAAIRNHHRVDLAPPEHFVATAIVHLGDAASHREPAWSMGEGFGVDGEEAFLERLGMHEDDLTAALDEARAEIEQAASALAAAP